MSDILISWLRVADGHDAALLLAIAVLAGLVRGFAGFGAGMVFVPVAATVVGPAAAVGLIWTIDVPITLHYAAGSTRGCNWRDIGPLLLGCLLGLPVGMMLLTGLDPTALRWATSVFILLSVAAMASGWRYHGRPGMGMTGSVGLLSGLTTGLIGIGGPFIAMFWLGGPDDAGTVKRNLNAYFGLTTVTIGPAFFVKGIITGGLILSALPLIVAYTAGVLAGTSGFQRGGQGIYRPIALFVAAAAAISSLPVLDPWLR